MTGKTPTPKSFEGHSVSGCQREFSGSTRVLGFVCPLGHVILRPPVSEHNADAWDVGPGSFFRCEAELKHVTQGRASHGASAHVLHLGHSPLDLLRRGVLAQGELGAHVGGVLQEADARARPGNVQRVHDAVDELLDQLEVGGSQTLGAVDDENQIQRSAATLRLCQTDGAQAL